MTRVRWIVLVLLALVFVGLLVYGVQIGDAEYVFTNAQSICYT